MAGNPVKTFSCPACGGVMNLRAHGHSINAVCSHCSSLIDTANDNFKIILKAHERSREIDIPLGRKGVLDGIKWEVIGYVEKKDKSSVSFWDEYLLFNPYFGFRFLLQYDGHWNLASVIKRYYPLATMASEFEQDDKKFSVYCRGQASVEYVKGEFYWRLRKGDMETYSDFISPPHMLSVEKSKDEITLSMGVYVPAAEVEQAFDVSLDSPVGIAPNQPPPFFGTLKRVWKIAGVSLFVALMFQLNMGGAEVVNTTFINMLPDSNEKTFSTPVFILPARANLVVSSDVPLSNNWMELGLSLVNENSNETYEARQVVEYYYGYDGGESWSEGGQTGETVFSAIPAGNYRVVLEPTVGPSAEAASGISIVIKRNVRVWGNFWMIALLMLIFPVYAWLYRWNFEHKRWENSDYAPAIFRIGEGDD